MRALVVAFFLALSVPLTGCLQTVPVVQEQSFEDRLKQGFGTSMFLYYLAGDLYQRGRIKDADVPMILQVFAQVDALLDIAAKSKDPKALDAALAMLLALEKELQARNQA